MHWGWEGSFLFSKDLSGRIGYITNWHSFKIKFKQNQQLLKPGNSFKVKFRQYNFFEAGGGEGGERAHVHT